MRLWIKCDHARSNWYLKINFLVVRFFQTNMFNIKNRFPSLIMRSIQITSFSSWSHKDLWKRQALAKCLRYIIAQISKTDHDAENLKSIWIDFPLQSPRFLRCSRFLTSSSFLHANAFTSSGRLRCKTFYGEWGCVEAARLLRACFWLREERNRRLNSLYSRK